MDSDFWLVFILGSILLFVVGINAASAQKDLDIEKIKDAVIENPEITCMEYLQSIEE